MIIMIIIVSFANRFSVDAETGQLTISQVMRTDAGEISCLVENRAGKISQVAMLNVNIFLIEFIH